MTREEADQCYERAAQIADMNAHINDAYAMATTGVFPETMKRHAFHLQAECSRVIAEAIRMMKSKSGVENCHKSCTVEKK